MSINPGMMSSKTPEWATPRPLFDGLDRRYGPFTLDPCATAQNAKCSHYFTVAEDGLSQRWTGRVFMNPPYGRRIQHWVRKAYESCRDGDAEIVVCLVPARTDTSWWHDYCMAGEIEFIRGRVYFEQEGKSDRAPFPSAIVVFRHRPERANDGNLDEVYRSGASDSKPEDNVCPYCGDGMNSVGTLNHIECVRALTEHLVELEDELSDSRRREQLLQGALDAQMERDLAACERVGEPWFDGDTADHLADLLIEEREARMLAETETVLLRRFLRQRLAKDRP